MTFVVADSYIILHCLLSLVSIKVTIVKFSLMCTVHRNQGFHFMKLHKPVVSAELGRLIRFCKHFCNVIIWKSLMSKFHCFVCFFLWFREPSDTVTVWQAPSHEAGSLWICQQLHVPFLHCLLYSGHGDAEVCKYSLQWNGLLVVILHWYKRIFVTKQGTDRNI